MSTVAMLGMGAMGRRMAINLLKAGHKLRVWNRSLEKCNDLVAQGATSLISPRLAAQNADYVISMVRDDQASRFVWLDEQSGVLKDLNSDTQYIECSTLSLDWCRQLSDAIYDKGGHFLDAPVVGSRPQADSRQLVHLVGGYKGDFESSLPVLQANADQVHRIGGPGKGMAMKLAINALFGVQVAALGELMGFIRKNQINDDFASELLGKLPVTSVAARGILKAMVSKTYAPHFPVNLVYKDFGYVLNSSEDIKAEIPLTRCVFELFARAIDSGLGEENVHAITKLFDT